MTWKLSQGELLFLCSSTALGDVNDDILPKDQLWEYYMDGPIDKEKVVQRLKDFRVPRDMIDELEPPPLRKKSGVYFIQWPRNISKLIFSNFMEALKKYESWYGDYLVDVILRDVLPLSRGVDAASDDVEFTNSNKVKAYRQDLRRRFPELELLEEGVMSGTKQGVEV